MAPSFLFRFTNAYSNLGLASVVEAISVIAVLLELNPISLYFCRKLTSRFIFLRTTSAYVKSQEMHMYKMCFITYC